nr:uncharacterized protein LOC120964702 [Aegilops tauschii subsp. strangulata]
MNKKSTPEPQVPHLSLALPRFPSDAIPAAARLLPACRRASHHFPAAAAAVSPPIAPAPTAQVPLPHSGRRPSSPPHRRIQPTWYCREPPAPAASFRTTIIGSLHRHHPSSSAGSRPLLPLPLLVSGASYGWTARRSGDLPRCAAPLGLPTTAGHLSSQKLLHNEHLDGVVQVLAVDEEGQQTTVGAVSLLCPTRVPPNSAPWPCPRRLPNHPSRASSPTSLARAVRRHASVKFLFIHEADRTHDAVEKMTLPTDAPARNTRRSPLESLASTSPCSHFASSCAPQVFVFMPKKRRSPSWRGEGQMRCKEQGCRL